MGNLAIIPARGGSKRIPRKNIKDFLGKPIIAYSIDAALQSGLFEEVMVSTDDDEIAKIAEKCGAKVPFLRSEANANDFATTLQVLKEVEADYLKQQLRTFDFICCIYPTAPLMKVEHLQEGYQLIANKEVDVVFPVVAFSYPIWRGLAIENGITKMVWPAFQNRRSQDLNVVYHDAGQWYWYMPNQISGVLITSNAKSIILEENAVQDIDTLLDWKLAEMKFNLA